MNNLEKKLGVKKIPLENIELSDKNPRFNSEWKVNESLIVFLQKGNKNYPNNENAIAIELLKQEGVFEDFYELITSIKENGFNEDRDAIYVVNKEKTNSETNEKYIVAEGNRRILALKLLNGLMKWPKIEKFSKKQIPEGEISDKKADFEIKRNYDSNDLVRNHKKIERIVTSNNKTFAKKIDLIQVQDEQLLSQIVFSRHSAGAIRGKRNWKSGKYYWNLWQFTNKVNLENNELLIEKIALKYCKSQKQIKEDIRISKWVINIVIQSEEFKDDLEIQEFTNKESLSSLQKQFIKKSIQLKNWEIETNIDIFFEKKTGINSKKNWDDLYEDEIFKKFSKLIINLYRRHNNKRNEMSITTRIAKHSEEAESKIKEFFEIIDKIKPNEKWKDIKTKSIIHLTKKRIQNLEKNSENTNKDKKQIEIFKKYEDVFKTMEEEIFDKQKLQIEEKFKDSPVLEEIFKLWKTIIKFKNMKKQELIHPIAAMTRTVSELINFAILEQEKELEIFWNISKKECPVCKRQEKEKIKICKNRNISEGKYEKINVFNFIYKEKHQKKRIKTSQIAKQLLELQKNTEKKNNQEYQITTKDGNILFTPLNFIHKNEWNKIIHEPYNFFKKEHNDYEKKEKLINLLEEISNYTEKTYWFILGLYQINLII